MCGVFTGRDLVHEVGPTSAVAAPLRDEVPVVRGDALCAVVLHGVIGHYRTRCRQAAVEVQARAAGCGGGHGVLHGLRQRHAHERVRHVHLVQAHQLVTAREVVLVAVSGLHRHGEHGVGHAHGGRQQHGLVLHVDTVARVDDLSRCGAAAVQVDGDEGGGVERGDHRVLARLLGLTQRREVDGREHSAVGGVGALQKRVHVD